MTTHGKLGKTTLYLNLHAIACRHTQFTVNLSLIDFTFSLNYCILYSCTYWETQIHEFTTILFFQDVNERPTELTLTKFEIRENQNDTLVGMLEITDPDVGQRHKCNIVGDETMFYIDDSGNSPTLKTAQPLDFELSRMEYVNIRCVDIVLDQPQNQFEIYEQFKINVIGMAVISNFEKAFKTSSIHFTPGISISYKMFFLKIQ